MSNWKPVSNFVSFSIKGITPKYVENSSIIVLNQKCIRNGKIDYSLSQFTDDTKQIAETKFIQRGDILVNSTGIGTAGRCAFVNELPENYKLITDSHILLLRCNSYNEAQCLSYLLFSFEKKLMTFMTGSSGQSELDKVVLLNLRTKFPIDPSIQQTIANVLSSLDSKIEINNKINIELEAMAKMLYDYWFVQYDFPNKNGKPYKSSGGKMFYSKELKKEIPLGWETKRVEDVLAKETSFKKIPTSEYLNKGSIPIIDQSNYLITGFTNDIKFKIDCDIARIIFGDHTRILKLVNFDFARGADGTQVLLSNNKRIPQHLFYHSLLKIDLSNYGYARHFKFLKDCKIILPEEVTSYKFESLVEDFYKKIKSNIFQNQQLTELRDLLLPMLMNGQITVSNESAFGKDEVLAMVAEPSAIYEKTVKVVAEKVGAKKPKKDKTLVIKLNPVDVYKRTLLAAEIVFQYKSEYTLGHLKLQKMLYLCKESENMNLPMNFLKQAMGPYDNQLARSLDKQFEEKKWFKYQNGASLKYAPLENCGKHSEDFKKHFEDQLPTINSLITTFRKFKSQEIEAVATLYACWKEAIANNELVNDAIIINKFYDWSKEKEKFNKPDLVNHLAWMRKNGIYPKN